MTFHIETKLHFQTEEYSTNVLRALAQGDRGTIEREGFVLPSAGDILEFPPALRNQLRFSDLPYVVKGRVADMSNRRAVVDRSSEPASLYRVMQAMIGEGLREHYEVPQKMSHELFVLLMQMNERNTGAARRAKTDTLSKRQSVG
jgi:hypothetical protein